MTISVVCKQCKSKVRVPDQLAGRQGRCPKCKAPIRVSEVNTPDAILSRGLSAAFTGYRPLALVGVAVLVLVCCVGFAVFFHQPGAKPVATDKPPVAAQTPGATPSGTPARPADSPGGPNQTPAGQPAPPSAVKVAPVKTAAVKVAPPQETPEEHLRRGAEEFVRISKLPEEERRLAITAWKEKYPDLYENFLANVKAAAAYEAAHDPK
jgi:hypothetical protein